MRDFHRIYRPSLGWLAVVALFAVPVFTLSGAVDMFLRLYQINGESLDAARKGDIDVLAWSWGASNSGTTHIGGGGGAGAPNVQDISVTKYIDKSSPTLLLNTMNGKRIASGELVVRKAGLKQPLEYLKIEMKDILITSLSTGGSGGEDRLTENVSLNFGRYRLTYTPENQDGTPGTPLVVQWNIAENTSNFTW
jgi:type VI secretion system secreted protein Hcp